MKGLFYILFVLFIGAIVFSVVKLDFEASLWSSVNNFQWMTIGAAICGILLGSIFLRYQDLKENLEKN